ncbi:holo-(acyl carrier protein) synthase 2, partial [Haemophilus influenzae]
KICFL